MKDEDIYKIAKKDLEHFRRTDGRGNVYGISEANLKHFARDIEAFVLAKERGLEIVCGTCGGEGVIDSGGVDQNDNWVNVACPDCQRKYYEVEQ